jgi:hypothetical protein
MPGSPQSTLPSKHPQRPPWDAALKPAQHRAELARAQRRERTLADARRRHLITSWRRELASR